MKKLLTLCLALALLLCGCAKPQESAPSSAQTEPPSESEPTEPVQSVDNSAFGLSYLPSYGLNPFTCAATVNRAVFSLVFESLIVVSNQFRAEPLLCESFTPSEDGLTYYYTILSGVSF